jgi:DNA-binding helix-hairpin-helix protein with protein kinase domain
VGHKRAVWPAWPQSLQGSAGRTLRITAGGYKFRRGLTWAHYLQVARRVANAVTVLHGKGCAHSDIHYRNFLADIDRGEAVMLEIDGVVVSGFLRPQVKGMMGFMAPEILAHRGEPGERTDRYSLAILLLHTLLFRNPMQPLLEYDADVGRSEELGWGDRAVFSEHPRDARNRPRRLGIPMYREGALSYRMLTPTLQRLTERALIDGLWQPERRPAAREWEECLGNAQDELWACSLCGQYQPYPHWLEPAGRRRCVFCGAPAGNPSPAVLHLYDEHAQGQYWTCPGLVDG